MKTTVLITGSSGYIGSHLVKYFKQMGAIVYGIDLQSPQKNLQPYFDSYLVDDISNQKTVSKFLKDHLPDLIIHCAGKCLVAESVEKPDVYHDYNVERASAFLKICMKHKISNFLYSSSAATYGESLEMLIKESHPQNPINPYGQTKLEFEKILRKKKFCTSIVRYFNVAGADPAAEIGEHHEPGTRLVPNLLRSVSENKSVNIYGTDYLTKDGTCVRDYIHVWDLANFHWLLSQRMIRDHKGGIYNLGSACGFSILEVIKATEKILGKTVAKKILSKRLGDPSSLVADITKARQELDWNPKFSSLELIIETAWAWHKKN